MIKVSATELARKLRKILDSVEFRGQQVVVVRNGDEIARIIAHTKKMTALEAMADLHTTLPEDAAKDWIQDSKMESQSFFSQEIKDPWKKR